jgi:TRAP-type C4-dicarboxylate transport system permease large subunit
MPARVMPSLARRPRTHSRRGAVAANLTRWRRTPTSAGLAIMMLTVPVLLPVTQLVGIDPVHFGIVVVMNLMIGVLTPPFGMARFVVSKVGGIPFGDLAKAIRPFIPPLLIVLLICTLFPGLVLFLPKLFLC